MSTRATVLSALAVGILGAGAWVAWWSQAQAAEPPETPKAPPAAPPTQMPVPMVATNTRPAPKPERNPRDTSLMTRLPDGSYIPNLNGVRQPMSWNGEFSPIVRINRTDAGVDWWVHESGLQSTVIVLSGTKNGVPVQQPTLLKAFPRPARPIYEPPKK